MGQLIDRRAFFTARRLSEPSIEALRGFAMLRVMRNFDYFDTVEQALLQVLRHPRFPALRVEDADLVIAADLLHAADHARSSMIFSVSLNRFRCELRGWDPMSIPACAALAEREEYLLLREAVATIALVWQVVEHPDDVLISDVDFHRSFPPVG